LFRQFALTISGAVVISTINALTLSPALCALLLRPAPSGGARRFFLFRWFNAAFDSDNRRVHRTVAVRCGASPWC
jgi:multidrug efflux pump subunit AcrB